MKTRHVLHLFVACSLVLVTVSLMKSEVLASPSYGDGDFSWAKHMGGTGYESGNSIAADSSGNIYITGNFQDTVDFDPGDDVVALTSVGPADLFVSRLDGNGNLSWAKSIRGTGSMYPTKIAVDLNGNIYVTGTFSGDIHFDAATGIPNLTAGDANGDAFIIKLNGNGELLWAKSMTSIGGGWFEDTGYAVAVDSSGNVYTTGFFSGTVDFDPGAAAYNLSSGGADATFISRLDHNGNFVWAKSIASAGEDAGVGIAVDAGDDIYVAGLFSYTADFDPGTGTFNLTSAGSTDVFVTKWNSNGELIWAKHMGGADYDSTSGLNLDSAGNIYTTGVFEGTADFDPGATIFNLTSAGGLDIFISKWNGAGEFIWAGSLGGAGFEGGNSKVDSDGNVYTTGGFEGTTDFDPGPGTSSLTSAGGLDIFISKLNANGEYVWAKRIGGMDYELGSIAVDSIGNTYITGGFGATLDFDPGPDTFELTSNGGTDIFVLKLWASPSNISPVADAGGPYAAFSGETITLDASSSYDADGDVLTYEWDLDLDGEYDDATGVTPDISFFDVGHFTVGLRVTDTGSLSDTDTADVLIKPVSIDIDIRPGSDVNPINLSAKGVVPVAVLTTPDFDANTLDPATIVFAGAAPLRWVQEDVDWDGDVDMLLQINTSELTLNDNSIDALLIGKNMDGISVEGTDFVKIVPN